MKRIGVLTGGGDCPGLNAVLRAVVRTAILRYNMEVVGILDGFEGLISGQQRPLTMDSVSNILTQGGTIIGSSNKANPFEYYDESTKTKIDVSSKCMQHIKDWSLDALLCIGGDGTLSMANRFYKLGMPIIGIPKTIDNDVAATDFTFGHDTAVENAASAIDKARDTAQSHHRIIVVETMGRYVGWIALRAGMAGGADTILIPEIPYDLKYVEHCIQQRVSVGKRFSIVTVAEGAKPKGGDYVIDKIVEGSPDPIRLGGVARVIAEQLESSLGIEARSMVLGYIQRGGTPTVLDRLLSTRFGYHAVELAHDEIFGRMVALDGRDIVNVALADAVAHLKSVRPDDALLQAGRAIGICFGDDPK